MRLLKLDSEAVDFVGVLVNVLTEVMQDVRNYLPAMPDRFSGSLTPEKGTQRENAEEQAETKAGKADPKNDLSPGEMNRVKLRSKNRKPVKVYNRFVKGMCGTVLVDLEDDDNGINWDMPSQIVVILRCPAPGTAKTTMPLCKLIATNRETFGSDWTQCPFEPVYERYSYKGVQYWNNAFRHCYWLASNAGKDVCMAARTSRNRKIAATAPVNQPGMQRCVPLL